VLLPFALARQLLATAATRALPTDVRDGPVLAGPVGDWPVEAAAGQVELHGRERMGQVGRFVDDCRTVVCRALSDGTQFPLGLLDSPRGRSACSSPYSYARLCGRRRTGGERHCARRRPGLWVDRCPRGWRAGGQRRLAGAFWALFGAQRAESDRAGYTARGPPRPGEPRPASTAVWLVAEEAAGHLTWLTG
jgi:hypothetical protein